MASWSGKGLGCKAVKCECLPYSAKHRGQALGAGGEGEHLAGEGSVQAGAQHKLQDQPSEGLGKAQVKILPRERPTLHSMTACSVTHT